MCFTNIDLLDSEFGQLFFFFRYLLSASYEIFFYEGSRVETDFDLDFGF